MSIEFKCKECGKNMLLSYSETPNSPLGKREAFYVVVCPKCNHSATITSEKMKSIQRKESDYIEL